MTEISDWEKAEIVKAAVGETIQTNMTLARAAWHVFSELEDRGFTIVKMREKDE